MNAQTISQTGQMIELCCEYLSNLVAVTYTSDMAPASSNEFFDIQVNYRV